QGERFLAKNVNSTAQCGHRHGKMKGRRSNDTDDVRLRLVEHFLEVAVVGRNSVVPGGGFRALETAARHGHYLRAGMRLKDRDLNISAEGCSGNGDSQFFR